MLELTSHLKIDEKTAKSPNLCNHFTKTDLDRIGNHVWEGYDRDKQSRSAWYERTEKSMNLALQIVEEKSFPWPKASNIAFPLLTIAALQFHSRAYPTLIGTTDVAQFRTIGADPDASQLDLAMRVGKHMSFQCMEEDQGWEEVHDRLFINVPIVGCAFVKSQYDTTLGHNTTSLVLAKDLVIDYFAKSVESARRKTHVVPKYKNDIWEKVKLGAYRNILDEAWYKEDAQQPPMDQENEEDNRSGFTAPPPDIDTPFVFLEQHCWLDLDGDGYAEPYVVLVEEASRCVLRIVARWDREQDVTRVGKEIITIAATEAFTKYGLIPSPDGGIYDIGFGILGSLNHSVNTLINQLVDTGTMQNTAGGFLGRGAKIRGGVYTFAPLEWKRVDSTGDDLRKNIVPLPVRDPSSVLFQLLGMLVDYTNRISGATEMLAGQNPGQNTPAANGNHMVEQGLKIYAAIFKRMWRSLKQEFKKLYVLNAINLPTEKAYPDGTAMREDYLGDPNRICPTADPSVMSDALRMQQAMLLGERARMVPGYDIRKVELNILRAAQVDAAEAFYPGADKVPPLPNPKMEAEAQKLKGIELKIRADALQFSMSIMEEHELNQAKIAQLEAQATNLLSQAKGVETGHQIAMIDAQLGAAKAQDASQMGRMKMLMDLVKGAHEVEHKGRELDIMARKPDNSGSQAAT